MKSSIELLHKLFRLPHSDRLLLGQAWAVLLLTDLIFRALPFNRVRAFCERVCRESNGPADPDIRINIQRVARLVEIAARYSPARTTCLTEALTLAWLLSRRGIATKIRIGVARQDSCVIAHAWLEREGRPVYGLSDENAYAPLLPVGSDAHR